MTESYKKSKTHSKLGKFVPLATALFITGCAGSLSSHGYELDIAQCHASGGEVLINHNSETMRCIY